MKKMIYLMLLLMLVGAASVNAQVRIGGTADPDKSAVLDLNPNEGNANGGLALPRVELTSETQQLNGAEPKPGTVVYNTSTALEGEGAYVWTKVGSGSGSGTDFTGISIATGTGTTVTGTGTVESPLKVDIATNGVTTDMIMDGQVTATKLNAMSATSGQVLKYIGSAWTPAADAQGVTSVTGAKGITVDSGTTTPVISLPDATEPGRLLTWTGTQWSQSGPANVFMRFIIHVTIPALEAGGETTVTVEGLRQGDLCSFPWVAVIMPTSRDNSLFLVNTSRNNQTEHAEAALWCIGLSR
jgi:hypothetical protein